MPRRAGQQLNCRHLARGTSSRHQLLRRLGARRQRRRRRARAEAGRDPYDRDLSDLVGDLSTESEIFRTLWAAHNVRTHDTGAKRYHHPVVGDLQLTYEGMERAADPGLTMYVFTAEPGSKSEEALKLLGSWTATLDQEINDADHEEHQRDRGRSE